MQPSPMCRMPDRIFIQFGFRKKANFDCWRRAMIRYSADYVWSAITLEGRSISTAKFGLTHYSLSDVAVATIRAWRLNLAVEKFHSLSDRFFHNDWPIV